MRPTVSVLLPTFNRCTFLPAALDAIRRQRHEDWELVVVDDGSTDATADIVRAATEGWPQPVRYVRQPNAGPYAARNTALEQAEGHYVAFYDSDDVWLPHHLATCVAALEGHPDVDWVYGACRTAYYPSGEVIAPTTFRVEGVARPFTRLRSEARGALRVITDPGLVACALQHGLYCGLQNSVIRRSVFVDTGAFRAADRNEAEDQLFVIRALKRGCRLGYIDDVHVQYHVHTANSSGSALGGRTPERQLALIAPVARGFEQLREQVLLTAAERRALDRRLNREYFWHLGYTTFWQHGQWDEAIGAFRRGLRAWPWDIRCWKTYLLARARLALGSAPRPRADRLPL